MPTRNYLNVMARTLGLDPSTYTNDSKLEQKILWLQKNATAFTGASATGVLTSDQTNVSDGDTVTVGSQVYTFKTALSGVKATGTLTTDATAFADGETFTIDGQTYVFRTALTNTVGAPYEVLIGVSAAVSLDNVKSAVNADGTAGVYGAGTAAHPKVTATTNANTTQLFVAKDFGTSFNSMITVETCAHASFGAATLTGGADRVANQVFIAASADLSLTNLVSAINGAGTPDTDYDGKTPVNSSVAAGAVTSHATTLTAKDTAVTNASVATTETSSHLSFGAATLASGVAKVIAADGSTVAGSAGISGDKDV